MLKFYSTNCPRCVVLKNLLDVNKIKYELIDDTKVIWEIADKNNLRSMPFGEIDGEILDTKELQSYIVKGGVR